MLPTASTKLVAQSAGAANAVVSGTAADVVEGGNTAAPTDEDVAHLIKDGSLKLAALSQHPKSPFTNKHVNRARWEFYGGDMNWYPDSTVGGHGLADIKPGALFSATWFKDENFGYRCEGELDSTNSNDGRRGGSAGLVYRFTKTSFSPTLYGMVGGYRFMGPVLLKSNGYYANPSTWSSSIKGGGSFDITVPHTKGHLALRADGGIEYLHFSYGPVYNTSVGGQANITSYRFAPGVVYRLGTAGAYKKRR